ncbi:histidine phosphotransferase family protein [Pontibaca salina]|uniref:Histidine phosphotransferase n=1 Tax=Pontibaca salina TaxID=2795731 RepID=A0A934LYQ2_9RHOB|nr:histidine phosphotransferase family protein [Pontibaca salina]MBI6630027.1 histidine phosphotransferase [Pontibaca salina]
MFDAPGKLAELIGSRICHDLISPIGAISNGLELLELTGASNGPEMDLIADSTSNASARLRFFRIAFGPADHQKIGRNEIVSVLDDITKGTRLAVHYVPIEPQPRSFVRLAFLAMQCCETAMPLGGSVRIEAENGHWSISGTAEKMNLDPTLWGHLKGGQAAVTAAQVQFALLPLHATDMNRALSVETRENGVSLHF